MELLVDDLSIPPTPAAPAPVRAAAVEESAVLVESLWSYVAAVAPHAVEVVLEVRRVVVWNARRLERAEVRQHHPARRGDHDVLGLEVAVHDAVLVADLQALEQLEQDPQLLQLVQKGSGGKAVVQVGAEKLTGEVNGGRRTLHARCGAHPHLVGQQVRVLGRR